MDRKQSSKRKNPSSKVIKQLKVTSNCPKCLEPFTTQDHFCECQTGIINIGNSCYISSVFQAISELQVFSSLNPEGNFFSLLTQLSSHSSTPLVPDLALEELKDLWTHENMQEDAFEFLMTLLPLLESSKFEFEFVSYKYCEICHFSYDPVIEEDYAFNMNLADKAVQGLQEQVTGIVEPVDEVCENCGKGFLSKLRTVTKEPEIFMVRVMRFQVNQKTGKLGKIWTKVLLPERLKIGNKEYLLNVVVLHKSKALNYGHYMVYLHKKKVIIDDEKVFYNKPLKMDSSYFYIAFYVMNN
jgi:uncharacterized UBP type Zn finger protein